LAAGGSSAGAEDSGGAAFGRRGQRGINRHDLILSARGGRVLMLEAMRVSD
jgi:hypothetical protein